MRRAALLFYTPRAFYSPSVRMTATGTNFLFVVVAFASLIGSAFAGTINSASFNGVTSGAVSTSGTADWGYVSLAGVNNLFSATIPYSNTAYGSLTNSVPTVITTVSGSSSIGPVTLTENATAGLTGQANGSNYTFNGNAVNGQYGGLSPSEPNAWVLTFSNLGVGTFNIALYLGHNQNDRTFRFDAALTDGITNPTLQTNSPQIGTLGSTVAAYGTNGSAFTYNISVTTTAATDDLSLTLSSLTGSNGGAVFGGYTVVAVPEPASLALACAGVAILGVRFYRRRKRV